MTYVSLPAFRIWVLSTSMLPLVLAVLGTPVPHQPMLCALASTLSAHIARQLQPLQHGISCETQANNRAKTTAQDMVQPDMEQGAI